MTIIVFGGNGLLGKELQKQNGKMFCPPSNTVNIENKDEVKEFIDIYKPDIVINAAAVLDNRILEKTPEKAISTNIIGAANVANVCIDNNIRYIYIFLQTTFIKGIEVIIKKKMKFYRLTSMPGLN